MQVSSLHVKKERSPLDLNCFTPAPQKQGYFSTETIFFLVVIYRTKSQVRGRNETPPILYARFSRQIFRVH